MRSRHSVEFKTRKTHGSGGKGREPVSKKIKGTIRQHGRVLKFILLVLLFMLIFSFANLYTIYHNQTVRIAINSFTAKATAFVMRILGFDTKCSGCFLETNGWQVEIIFECTAVYVTALYLSCVLAFPTGLKNKLIGVAFGPPVILVVNLFRLVSLFLIDLWKPQYSDFVHMYLWDASFIILVVILFLAWADIVIKQSTGKLIFLAKFMIYSIATFAFMTTIIKTPYCELLRSVVRFVIQEEPFHSRDDSIVVVGRIYNLVAFVSLLLATSKMPWRKKLRSLCIGLVIIFLYHITLSICANSRGFQNIAGIQRVGIDSIAPVLQLMLPLLLWILFTYQYTLKTLLPAKRRLPSPDQVCPICGRMKKGLEEHIRAIHGRDGEKYLKNWG